MKKIILILSVIFLSASTFAQEGSITGKVIAEDGEVVSMATIMLKNTQKGSQADENGLFKLNNIPEGKYTIVVSSVGFLQSESKVTVIADQNTQIDNITLKENTEELDEVVVNGNGLNDFVVKKPSPSLRLKTEVVKLPQNIQIISNEVLENQNIINMMESVTRNVSGAMMIEHWGTFARVNMRGFKLPAFRNGMNVEMPWGPLSEDMNMVEQIEFVKGPAGFMLSAGEPGGFYNVVTKKPTKESINKISFTAGSFNSYRAAFDSGGALTSNGKLQYRFNAMYQTAESHRDYDESSRYSIVPSLKYEISDKTSVITEFAYHRADQILGAAYVFAPADAGFASLDRNFSGLDPNMPKTNIEELNLTTNITHKFNDKWSVVAQHTYMRYDQVEGGDLWPDAVEPNGDVYRRLYAFDALNTNQLGQIYVDGEFNTGPIKHRVMGGFDFRDLSYYADWNQTGLVDVEEPFNIFNPEYGNVVFPEFDRSQSVKIRGEGNHQGMKYNAFYAQDELWMFNDRLRLTLAARYTDAEIFAYGNTSDDSKFTPRFGLSFDVLPSLTVYGLYDQSFTPNYGASATGQKFDPVEAKDIEGGIKKQWFDGRLNTSLTAYQITKQNLLVADPENPNFSIQIGEVQSKGFEFDVQGEITPELNVILNYANTNVEDLDGTRIAGHAKHMTNGWLNYNFNNESALHGFGVSLGYQYQVDRASWSWGAENEALLPNYFRLDGGLNWHSDHFNVNLNINNILDEYLYSGASYGSYVYWQAEPGINGRITVAYRF
ncbi:TonB-dependent receptor [Galbibacter sp. EGI 63066]|uniref:TonB-dependent receptor n=1 Tax=Galbibacter sp. EGI 63066 TaxID=2993559 RepID=UPI0022498A8F|nr:TonB-dependent receptor [Galbibacter sp. EGI 63066]MCX2679549.1 TonB-dependent receptor [Galbibacter sp. EGI 63066]